MKNISITTFRPVGSYELMQLKQDEASCFNGEVRIRTWLVTVEPIEEPREVLCERLQTLWDNGRNYRHSSDLRKVAEELGYELQGKFGNASEKKNG